MLEGRVEDLESMSGSSISDSNNNNNDRGGGSKEEDLK
jgi:hypothetical protein